MKLTKKTQLPHRTKLQPGIYLRDRNLPHKLIEKNLQIDKQNVFRVTTVSGVLIGNDIEHAAVSAYL